MRYFIALFLLLTSCASQEVTPIQNSMKSTQNYAEVIDQYSEKVRTYSGFYNTMDIEGTILNSNVAKAQLDMQASIYQWDQKKSADEKAKFENRLSQETELFLSFFTPDKKNDDLSKNKTIWRFFLDLNGHRYEGKVTKIKLPLSEIQSLYPYHNRFYTPYSIKFPVSIRSIESKPIEVTLTGAVSAGALTFNP
jgi:hypothetical protein